MLSPHVPRFFRSAGFSEDRSLKCYAPRSTLPAMTWFLRLPAGSATFNSRRVARVARPEADDQHEAGGIARAEASCGSLMTSTSTFAAQRFTYRWWDCDAQSLPSTVGRNTRTGKERPNTAVPKKSDFELVPDTATLVARLFGEHR